MPARKSDLNWRRRIIKEVRKQGIALYLQTAAHGVYRYKILVSFILK